MENDKFKNSEIKGMFEGPLTPIIMKLAIPILAGMVFQLLYNLVDTSFINFIDPDNPAILGGTGYIFPIIFIAMALGQGLQVGMSALVAKGIGAKDDNIIYKTAESGLFLALIVTVVMLTGSYVFSEEIVTALGAKGEYFKYGHEYFIYIIPVTFFMFFSMVLGGILQGEGLMDKFMKVMIIGTLLNIILDPFFIFESINLKLFTIPGLGMGVKGAAIATVLAQFISFIYMLSIFIRKQTLIQIEWNPKHITPSIMKKIVSLGFPQSFGQIIMSASFMIMNWIASSIDEQIVTSSSLVGRVEQMIYMPVFAIAAACITIAGQNRGRGNLDRVEDSWKKGMGVSLIFIVVTGSVFLIFANSIYGFFQQSSQVTYYAVTQTRYMVPFFVVVPVVVITRSIYQAIGYPIPGLIIIALRFFIIIIPAMLIYVFVFNLGFKGMLYGHMTSMVISAIIAWFWMKTSMNKLKAGELKTIN